MASTCVTLEGLLGSDSFFTLIKYHCAKDFHHSLYKTGTQLFHFTQSAHPFNTFIKPALIAYCSAAPVSIS